MINIEDFVSIGKLGKPHGVKGEISFLFTNDIFDRSDCNYIICLMDEIPVPFFIEEYRFKGNEIALLKLKGIENEEEAKEFVGKEVYFPKSEMDLEEESLSWDYFIGFTVIDKALGRLGSIKEMDDSTINILFLVTDGTKEILIPANEEWILKVDHSEKIIHTSLPEGLVEL